MSPSQLLSRLLLCLALGLCGRVLASDQNTLPAGQGSRALACLEGRSAEPELEVNPEAAQWEGDEGDEGELPPDKLPLWIPVPLLDDFPIEILEPNEDATAAEPKLAVWVPDLFSAGDDLSNEARTASDFADSTALSRFGPAVQRSAPETAAVAEPSELADWRTCVGGGGKSTSAFARSSTLLGGFAFSPAYAVRPSPYTSFRLAREPPGASAPTASRSVASGFSGGAAQRLGAAASPQGPRQAPSAFDGGPVGDAVRESLHYEALNQAKWGARVNAAPTANNLLFGDRSLASLKLDGVGSGWDREGVDLGKEINLNGHTLTFTYAGVLSVGERRNTLTNGKISTTRKNFEFQVTGGGLEISAMLGNGTHGATGLIKTGSGELILSQENAFSGTVYVNAGMLTLRSKGVEGGAIVSKSIYVGDGSAPAILNLKGGRDHINPEATVTLRGGESGADSILRFEKTHPKKGVTQTLVKLVIEGSGIIEFIDPFSAGGKVDSINKNALYIEELDLRGDLSIRGWDQYDTQIFIKRAVQPDDELLSKIHVEGHANLRVSSAGNGFWSIEAAPVPEAVTCGGVLAGSALALALWRRRRACCSFGSAPIT